MRCPACLLALGTILLAGCAGPPPAVDEVMLQPGQYPAAFDAALLAAREEGFTPTLRDRRAGRIATDPAPAATILEPWRDAGIPDSDRLEHTLSHDRRRVRFEFSPAGDAAPRVEQPDLLGLTPSPDLTTHPGPVKVTAWVTIERQHAPGLRRDRWTRRATSRTTYPGSNAFWAPVRRDVTMERRLLAAMSAQLAPPDPPR